MTGSGMIPRGVYLSEAACPALVDRLADPTWRASLPPETAQAVSAILHVARSYIRERAEIGNSGMTSPAPLPCSNHDATLDTAAVARRLHVSDRQVRILAESGQLRGHRTGRPWRFREADVADYLRRWAA